LILQIYLLTPTAIKTASKINIGVVTDEEAETTGSSISGVAIEPAESEVAASENAAANNIFLMLFSNFDHFLGFCHGIIILYSIPN
jgi:hypothetical protein